MRYSERCPSCAGLMTLVGFNTQGLRVVTCIGSLMMKDPATGEATSVECSMSKDLYIKDAKATHVRWWKRERV